MVGHLISNMTSSIPALPVLSWPFLTFWFSPLVLDTSLIITCFIITCSPSPPHQSCFTLEGRTS